MRSIALTALMVVLGWSATADAQSYYYDPGLRAYVAYPATTVVTPSGVIQTSAATVVPSTTTYYYPSNSTWIPGNYYTPYRSNYYSDSYYTPYYNYTPYSNYSRYYYGSRGWRR